MALRRDGEDDRQGPTRSLILAGIALLSVSAVLALAWHSAATLLLIFAGVLFGVFLGALTRLLGRVLRIGHAWRLAIVCVVLTGLFLGLLGFGGVMIAGQASSLIQTLRQQITEVRSWLDGRGVDASFLDFGSMEGSGQSAAAPGAAAKPGDGAAPPQEGGAQAQEPRKGGAPAASPPADAGAGKPRQAQPQGGGSSGNVLSQAVALVIAVVNGIGNFFIVVVLGLFFAAQPRLYRDGILRFVPPAHRNRAAVIVDEMGLTLQHWLIGQSITMSIIFVCVWTGLSILSINGALILAIQAGLMVFISNVGPVIAGAVIVLGSLASGPGAALGGLVVYVIVQGLESNILTPLIQKRALNIPPSTIFAGQILLASLFGIWGLALALPLMAVAKVLVDRLYLEDRLGEAPPHPAAPRD